MFKQIVVSLIDETHDPRVAAGIRMETFCHGAAPRCKAAFFNGRIKAEQVAIRLSLVISRHSFDSREKRGGNMFELALKPAHVKILAQHAVCDVAHNKIKHGSLVIARKSAQSLVLSGHAAIHVPNNAGFRRKRERRHNKMEVVNINFRQNSRPIQRNHATPRSPQWVAAVNNRYAICS